MGNHTRRPLKFWEVFNKWWRGELDALGRRPCANEIIKWYETHAAEVWLPGVRPTLQETRMHAKCLRSLDGVRSYFKRYRRGKRNGVEKDLSSEDESEAISREPSPRKYRTRAIKPETATSSAERSAATTVFTSPKSTCDAWNASTKPAAAIPSPPPAAGASAVESAPTSLPVLPIPPEHSSCNLLEDATVPAGSKRPRAVDPNTSPAPKAQQLRTFTSMGAAPKEEATTRAPLAPLLGMPSVPQIRTDGHTTTSQLTWLLSSPRPNALLTPRGPTPVGGGDDGDDANFDELLHELGDGLATPFKGTFPWSSHGDDSPLGIAPVMPWVTTQDGQPGNPSNISNNIRAVHDRSWQPQLRPTLGSYGSGDWLNTLVDVKPPPTQDHHLLMHRNSAPIHMPSTTESTLPHSDHSTSNAHAAHQFMGPSVSSPVSSALARWSARDGATSNLLHTTHSYPGPLGTLATARSQENLALVQPQPQHVLRNNMVVTLPPAPLPPQRRQQVPTAGTTGFWATGTASLTSCSGNNIGNSLPVPISTFHNMHQRAMQGAHPPKSQPGSLPPFPFPDTGLLRTCGSQPTATHQVQSSASLPHSRSSSNLGCESLWGADVLRGTLPLSHSLLNKGPLADTQPTHARQSTPGGVGATTTSTLASQLGGVLSADPLPMLPLSHKFDYNAVDRGMGAGSSGQGLQQRLSWPLSH